MESIGQKSSKKWMRITKKTEQIKEATEVGRVEWVIPVPAQDIKEKT